MGFLRRIHMKKTILFLFTVGLLSTACDSAFITTPALNDELGSLTVTDLVLNPPAFELGDNIEIIGANGAFIYASGTLNTDWDNGNAQAPDPMVATVTDDGAGGGEATFTLPSKVLIGSGKDFKIRFEGDYRPYESPTFGNSNYNTSALNNNTQRVVDVTIDATTFTVVATPR
jgi:hypothetical protein